MTSKAAKKIKNNVNLVIPQDEEAEKSILGSIMLDQEAMVKVADFLTPDDFYKKAHRIIYNIMLELYGKNEPIDILSVSSKIKEKELDKEIGGISYLTSLVNSVPSPAHIVHYGKIVQRKRILRDLINTSYQIHELVYDKNNDDIDMILDEAERKIFSIAQSSIKQDFLPIKSMLEDAFGRIEKLHQGPNNFRGVSTGFTDLDNYLGGLQRSDLIILAARPSLGKSALSLDIARHIATNEKAPVIIFNLEMSKDQIVDRFIAAQANVDLWKLRTGRLSSAQENGENDFVRISNAMATLSEAPIFINDTPIINVIQIKAIARRLQSKQGLGLIVVDYLQLIQSRNYYDNRVQEISEISRSLKALARELNVPVLALSQLSRAVEQRPHQIPRLADLRESGSIEQDADVVLFIYKEDKDKTNSEKNNVADIIIAKHRNGPTGTVKLYFNENTVNFKNLDKQHSEQPFF